MYMVSEQNNFSIIDTIGVPHPYCIGARHVSFASDNYNGMLGKDAIEAGEAQGITCAMRGCNLSYSEHEQVILIECNAPLHIEGETNKELHAYLLGLKEITEKAGFAGFAFKEGASLKQ